MSLHLATLAKIQHKLDKTKSRTVTKKLEDELSIEKHEVQITTQVLINSFKKLFEKVQEIEDLDEIVADKINLERSFEIGSKFVEIEEMSEQEKAKFSILLVKHFNLAK